MATAVYEIDPLTDSRWAELVERHPKASVFHTPGWLEALRRTYGYEPVVLTACPPTAELRNGLAFCRIDSWLTGRRMVSLPFSDHCEPLVDPSDNLQPLLQCLHRNVEQRRSKYIEIRPLSVGLCGLNGHTSFQIATAFYHHKLDLRPTLDKLFHNFHKSCVQRKIRRAEREALTYEEGRSESLLAKFYGLLLLTRRRQQLPPHPISWFRNLMSCLGDRVKIRVASKEGQPVASILTLSFKNVLVYKYGCSDATFNNRGATHSLLWKAIQEAKNSGLEELDLGRSACDNVGLVTFKDRWGATRSTLAYARYPAQFTHTLGEGWEMPIARKVFLRMPDSLLTATGGFLYRHIG